MDELKKNDKSESRTNQPTASALKEKIESLKTRKQEYAKLLKELDASKETGIKFNRVFTGRL